MFRRDERLLRFRRSDGNMSIGLLIMEGSSSGSTFMKSELCLASDIVNWLGKGSGLWTFLEFYFINFLFW